MLELRRVDTCVNCGRDREIAAFSLCFACYRRERRSFHAVPREHGTAAIRREQKKLLKAFTSVMTGLSDLGVRRDEILHIRALLAPYLEAVRDYLTADAGAEQ